MWLCMWPCLVQQKSTFVAFYGISSPPFFLFKLQYILCLSKIDPALKTQLEGVFLSSMQIKLRCFWNVLGGKNLLFCSE